MNVNCKILDVTMENGHRPIEVYRGNTLIALVNQNPDKEPNLLILSDVNHVQNLTLNDIEIIMDNYNFMLELTIPSKENQILVSF